MRGETCIAIATFFTTVSLILLIFAHVAQVNTSVVPRKLHMVQMNVTNWGTAFRAGTGVDAPGMYTANGSSPIGEGDGLRQVYLWGLYGFCAYIAPGPSQGHCGNSTFGAGYTPFNVFLADVPASYQEYSRQLVPPSNFKNSGTLNSLTHSGFDLLFVGTLMAFVALVAGLIKHKITFLLASFFSILGSILLLAGAATWTSAISKSQDINTAIIPAGTRPPLGIDISAGSALYLFWSAFAFLFISSVPYTISCWSYLKR